MNMEIKACDLIGAGRQEGHKATRHEGAEAAELATNPRSAQ